MEPTPLMKAMHKWAMADPKDCDREWAACLALVRERETASGSPPTNSTSPLHHHAPAAVVTAPATTRSTASLRAPSDAVSTTTSAATASTSTSTSNLKSATSSVASTSSDIITKDDLSPGARRCYDYLVGASTTLDPVHDAVDIDDAGLAVSAPTTCSSKCPSNDAYTSMSVVISSATPSSPTTTCGIVPELATPTVSDTALDVEVAGDSSPTAAICLLADLDDGTGEADLVDVSLTLGNTPATFALPGVFEAMPMPLTPWSVHIDFNVPAGNSPRPPRELFTWSPTRTRDVFGTLLREPMFEEVSTSLGMSQSDELGIYKCPTSFCRVELRQPWPPPCRSHLSFMFPEVSMQNWTVALVETQIVYGLMLHAIGYHLISSFFPQLAVLASSLPPAKPPDKFAFGDLMAPRSRLAVLLAGVQVVWSNFTTVHNIGLRSEYTSSWNYPLSSADQGRLKSYRMLAVWISIRKVDLIIIKDSLCATLRNAKNLVSTKICIQQQLFLQAALFDLEYFDGGNTPGQLICATMLSAQIHWPIAWSSEILELVCASSLQAVVYWSDTYSLQYCCELLQWLIPWSLAIGNRYAAVMVSYLPSQIWVLLSSAGYAGCTTLYGTEQFDWQIAWLLDLRTMQLAAWSSCAMFKRMPQFVIVIIFPCLPEQFWTDRLSQGQAKIYWRRNVSGQAYYPLISINNPYECSVDKHIHRLLFFATTALGDIIVVGSSLETSHFTILVSLLLPWDPGGCASSLGDIQDISLHVQCFTYDEVTGKQEYILNTCAYPWNPGDSTGTGLRASRILRMGDCQRPLHWAAALWPGLP